MAIPRETPTILGLGRPLALIVFVAAFTFSAIGTVMADGMTNVAPAPSYADGTYASQQLGDLATDPVDGQGEAIQLHQDKDQAAESLNCTLHVPNDPLSAAGLATPWELGDGCRMTNMDERAFVEATILAPDGSLQVYNPLVITAGSTPAVTPLPPAITDGSTVIIDIGFNGNNLVLTGQGAQQGNCVDALGQSVIGQVSACNAVSFYTAANAEVAQGILKVPGIGIAADGQPCETTRDFALVDQDQSDNVVTQYLINDKGQTAQNTAQNASAIEQSTVITNGSDDALLSQFVDPANGCSPFTVPDSSSPNGYSAAQALNELSAQENQMGAIAVVPPNDAMTLVNGDFSLDKTNVYRSLVFQPLLAAGTSPEQVAMTYCQNLVNIAPARNQLDWNAEVTWPSPVPTTGTNLATFLAERLRMSFMNLHCARFGLTNPVQTTRDDNGVATNAIYDTTQQQAGQPDAPPTAAPAAAPDPDQQTPPAPAPSHHEHHHWYSGICHHIRHLCDDI